MSDEIDHLQQAREHFRIGTSGTSVVAVRVEAAKAAALIDIADSLRTILGGVTATATELMKYQSSLLQNLPASFLTDPKEAARKLRLVNPDEESHNKET